jgi:hypothetical protein
VLDTVGAVALAGAFAPNKTLFCSISMAVLSAEKIDRGVSWRDPTLHINSKLKLKISKI